MTVGQTCREAERQLDAAGISGAGVEARAMLCAALGADYADFFPLRDREIDPATAARFAEMLDERRRGRPAAYICGIWEFFGLELSVTEDVLIPRADTEILVEEALRIAKGKRGLRILDLCCGSGCIGIATAKNLSDASLVLSDISPAALAVAEKNARRHLPEGSFRCELRDALLPRTDTESFDLILSNPPYVTEAEYQDLDRSVREYEPRLALVGAEEGLVFYRRIPQAVRPAVATGGALLFECGAGQASAVSELLSAGGWQSIRSIKDSAGIDRVVCARAPQV